jgi:hypothetical protein
MVAKTGLHRPVDVDGFCTIYHPMMGLDASLTSSTLSAHSMRLVSMLVSSRFRL